MCDVTNPSRDVRDLDDDEDGWEQLRAHDAAELASMQSEPADQGDGVVVEAA